MAQRVNLKVAIAAMSIGLGVVFGGATGARASDCDLECSSVERDCCSGGRCAFTMACAGMSHMLPNFMPNPEHQACVQGVQAAKLECQQQEIDCRRQCRAASASDYE